MRTLLHAYPSEVRAFARRSKSILVHCFCLCIMLHCARFASSPSWLASNALRKPRCRYHGSTCHVLESQMTSCWNSTWADGPARQRAASCPLGCCARGVGPVGSLTSVSFSLSVGPNPQGVSRPFGLVCAQVFLPRCMGCAHIGQGIGSVSLSLLSLPSVTSPD